MIKTSIDYNNQQMKKDVFNIVVENLIYIVISGKEEVPIRYRLKYLGELFGSSARCFNTKNLN